MNKYEKQPEFVLDLHGHTTRQAQEVLDGLVKSRQYRHVRIITGKGTFRETGPVLRTFVEAYLKKRGIPFQTAKLYHGGEGALEAFFSP